MQSSPEFAGVRRGSSGPNFYVKMLLQKLQKLVKNVILTSECCFSMRFSGETCQNTRRKCLKIFAHKVKFVGVCRA